MANMMHFIPLSVFSCYNHNDRASVIPVSPGRVLVPGLETASQSYTLLLAAAGSTCTHPGIGTENLSVLIKRCN